MIKLRFKDLAVGRYFVFEPGTDAFGVTCRKISARRYEWRYQDGRWMTSHVGTINVGVCEAALTP